MNACESILGLSPYQGGKPIEELERELGIKNVIKLASNENPLGPSLKVVEAMKLSAQDLLDLKIIDEIIKEPLGGAHRDKNALLDEIKKSIRKNLKELSELSREDILNHRKQKFLSIGRKKGLVKNIDSRDRMTMEENVFSNLKQKINKNKIVMIITLALAALVLLTLLYL